MKSTILQAIGCLILGLTISIIVISIFPDINIWLFVGLNMGLCVGLQLLIHGIVLSYMKVKNDKTR